MKRILVFLVISVFAVVSFTTSCRHKPMATPVADSSAYPDSIAAILVNKCTNAGCHNQASYQNAGQLLLDSWAHLFNGGVSGAVVVAYDTTYSPLLYYVCPDSALGTIVNDPGHLPAPLTTSEYLTLRHWVALGAPDKNGNVPFASNPDTRQKIYLTNQGCNLVAVIDAQSKLVMRYVHVGDLANVTPHDVVVSSDGAYAYVSLFDGNEVQKIDTRTDVVVGTLNLNTATLGGASGQWSIISLSPQDTAFMVSGYLQDGYMVTANTSAMQTDIKKTLDQQTSGGGNLFPWPHGLTNNPTFDTFFAALQYGNEVVKFGFSPRVWYKYLSVNGQTPGSTTDTTNNTTPNPHQLQMLPDNSRYFVTCQGTGMVSVMDAHTDSLISQIQVGAYPQEMALCTSKNYLFVVCMEDFNNPTAGAHGSVYVIDYTTLQVVKTLYGDFSEPHDIAVDNQDGLLFIANRNDDANGVVSHHSTSCGGNAGWYTVYDLNTLQPADSKRYEVTKDAYAISPRFK